MSGIRDYGALREEVLARAQASVRARAGQGLSAAEIEARLHDLTATERELLRPLIRSEVARARRARVADSLVEPRPWTAPSSSGHRPSFP
jgi:hypothetical protein